MPTNSNKGTAYQLVLSKTKSCAESDDIFHLIGLIASCESIMSDRLSAYLGGTKNEKHKQAMERNKFISLGTLLDISKKELEVELKIKTKDRDEIATKNLYVELWAWKEKRNQVIHAVCKSNSKVTHKSEKLLFAEAQCACLTGYRLVRLLLKWSEQRKRKYYKSEK